MKKLFIIPILAIFVSCEKFVEVDPPVQSILASNVFKDSNTAVSAISGLYLSVVGTSGFTSPKLGAGAATYFPGLSADELIPDAVGVSPEGSQFYNNAISIGGPNSPTGASELEGLWINPYYTIYNCNSVIEGLLETTTISTNLKNQLIGEAKFLRAFSNFYLANMFGPIPLIKSTDYTKNRLLSRSSIEDVYKDIEQDLLSAQQLVSTAYPSAGKYRVNKAVVTAFLSRLYLYQKNWSAAEAAATELVQSAQYLLETNLNNVFLVNSKEAIYQFYPSQPASFQTIEGLKFIPVNTTSIPSIIVNEVLVNSFEGTDQRKASWLNKVTVGGKDYYYPFKYKIRISSGSAVSEPYTVFRLAEQYLIRAEARCQLNKLTEAVSDINVLRTRAGIPAIVVTTQASIMDTIVKERRSELFVEWGHRWFDLKRLNLADATLSAVKPGWKPTAILFPIPYRELNVHPNLTQNSGY
jgi:starch-binding outer membrane protein, SusD/RagB family